MAMDIGQEGAESEKTGQSKYTGWGLFLIHDFWSRLTFSQDIGRWGCLVLFGLIANIQHR